MVASEQLHPNPDPPEVLEVVHLHAGVPARQALPAQLVKHEPSTSTQAVPGHIELAFAPQPGIGGGRSLPNADAKGKLAINKRAKPKPPIESTKNRIQILPIEIQNRSIE